MGCHLPGLLDTVNARFVLDAMQQAPGSRHPSGMRRRRSRNRSRVLKGAVAGAIGGLAGAGAMSLFAFVATRLTRRREALRSDLARLQAGQFVSGSAQELDSIGAAADWVDAHLLRHRASPWQKSVIAAGVHYAAGAGLGAVYGAAAEMAPVVTYGLGVPFAVAESAVVESGLTSAVRWGGPRGYTVADHLQTAVEHGVYGVTLELVRRSARKAA